MHAAAASITQGSLRRRLACDGAAARVPPLPPTPRASVAAVAAPLSAHHLLRPRTSSTQGPHHRLRRPLAPLAASDTTTPTTTPPPPPPDEESPAPSTAARDGYRAFGVGAALTIFALLADHEAVDAHPQLAMALVFAGGMAGITLEELWGFSKAGVALLTAASLWVIRATTPGVEAAAAEAETSAALAQTSDLIFFLLAAMTVVEVVDAHGGFDGLAAALRPPRGGRRRGDDGGADASSSSSPSSSSSSSSSLLATRAGLATAVTGATFFMSALLDNLTTTIVVLSVVNRALADEEAGSGGKNDNNSSTTTNTNNKSSSLASLRLLLGGLVVVAANAGGAWTPIGDVTTTLLWVQGHLSPAPTLRDLFLPSLACAAVPLALLAATAPELRGAVVEEDEEEGLATTDDERQQQQQQQQPQQQQPPRSRRGGLVLGVGVGALLFTPVFRELTHLPASFGALSGLAALWLVTDALHFGESRSSPRVKEVLGRVDVEGVLFFAGVLLSVGALDAAGVLATLAAWLGDALPGGPFGLAAAIGVASAVVDNVPLVAAASSMFGGGGGGGGGGGAGAGEGVVAAAAASTAAVPMDAPLWQLIALAAGTGGSLLIIGSASGIALMSLNPGASFGWFLRRLTPAAVAGFVAGLGVYALQQQAGGALGGVMSAAGGGMG